MPKKKDTIYSSRNNTEKSMLSALKDITHSDAEAYFIIWKYAPQNTPRVTIVSGGTSTVTFSNVLKRGDVKVIKSSEDNFENPLDFFVGCEYNNIKSRFSKSGLEFLRRCFYVYRQRGRAEILTG